MQEPKTVNVYKCNCVIVSLNPKSRPIGMEEKGNLTKIKNLMPFFKVMWKFTEFAELLWSKIEIIVIYHQILTKKIRHNTNSVYEYNCVLNLLAAFTN